MDVVSTSGKDMSTKRKAGSHLRTANQQHIMKRGHSRADSERDSGFSDASSEHMSTMDNTDSEDSVQQGSKTTGSGPMSSQLAVMGGSYSSLSPMIIMNNVLLKQPVDNPPALKPWGFSPTVEVVQPVVQQPQVVFLQPVVSRQSSPASKEATSRNRRSKKYLPILKSYPKIAPHPGDSASSSGRGSASSSSSSSSGSERGSALTPKQWEHRQKEKNLCSSESNSGSATPCLPATPSTGSHLTQSRLSLPTTETSTSSSPDTEKPSSAISQADILSSLSFAHSTDSENHTLPVSQADSLDIMSSGDYSDSDCDTKRKRFCNTYNILSKSGLLDITLRTKELLRQNRRTQNELDRLREDTDLFLQALQSGDTSIWVKLQAGLREEEREKAIQTSLKAD
ncbi:CLOCK-interacting pacemaker [Cololabis saira]|uniref:CLOCK-interacting pacemaker n=1 Tax=Cololabis saira TaxID=129043 RepID=UPI002AD5273B|nr:CLOCK-interacting pacemaker [Cololabis saira]XP_061602242.1 CLOCK-interacting pacemaker [Cololabis saira]